MQPLFDPDTSEQILKRIDGLGETSERQCGQLLYKHLNHHLTQFGL